MSISVHRPTGAVTRVRVSAMYCGACSRRAAMLSSRSASGAEVAGEERKERLADVLGSIAASRPAAQLVELEETQPRLVHGQVPVEATIGAQFIGGEPFQLGDRVAHEGGLSIDAIP